MLSPPWSMRFATAQPSVVTTIDRAGIGRLAALRRRGRRSRRCRAVRRRVRRQAPDPARRRIARRADRGRRRLADARSARQDGQGDGASMRRPDARRCLHAGSAATSSTPSRCCKRWPTPRSSTRARTGAEPDSSPMRRSSRAAPGKKDGLYWPVKDGEPMSPLGPLVAQAATEGYTTANLTPYRGYLFRILTGQGSSAAGRRVRLRGQGRDDRRIRDRRVPGELRRLRRR